LSNLFQSSDVKRIAQRNLRADADLDIKPHTVCRGSLTSKSHYMDGAKI
jgi:hypothetical protein